MHRFKDVWEPLFSLNIKLNKFELLDIFITELEHKSFSKKENMDSKCDDFESKVPLFENNENEKDELLIGTLCF